MKEKNLHALCSSMDILTAGLGVQIRFELKGNVTDSTVWNSRETGGINRLLSCRPFPRNDEAIKSEQKSDEFASAA